MYKTTHKKSLRELPDTITPVLYELYLKPDLQNFTFEGKVTVSIKVLESTNEIICNSLDLKIKEVELEECDGSISKPSVTLSTKYETVTLGFEKELKVGEAFLKFEFIGELHDKMRGFYRSKYINTSGEEKYSAVTQFIPTYARRCFPCWDDPAITVEFDISVYVPQNKIAFSNMPIFSEVILENGDRLVKFERTSIISPCLVTMIVGDFNFVEGKDLDGVPVRVYVPLEKSKQRKFVLKVAKSVLPYYKDYFQEAYPAPKFNLISLADFSSEALKNLSLVTYREAGLLVDPGNTSADRKLCLAVTVGHGLAHQWSGNLVSMEAWTHYWLNEGCASFVQFLHVKHLFPEYDLWPLFVTDILIEPLQCDALNINNATEIPVDHTSEIDEISDEISYYKGASVIRMLHNFIGDQDFRKGINLYLTRCQNNNTATESLLWAALEEVSNKPVKAVMSTWAVQKGYPLITVEEEIKKADGSRVLYLSQTKFAVNGQYHGVSPLWIVPLTFSTSQNPEIVCHTDVISETLKMIIIPAGVISSDDWVKVNPSTIGYYRTRYTPELLINFVPSISSKTLPPLDRLGLLEDLFALVQAGLSSTDDMLRIMLAMTDEDDYFVLICICRVLGKLTALLSNVERVTQQLFEQYCQVLLKKIWAKLRWIPQPEECHLNKTLRRLVIARLGVCSDPDVTSEAKIMLANHLSGKESIPTDLRSPIYETCMLSGGETAFNQLLQLYRETDELEEKYRICRAMGTSKNQGTLQKVLSFAESDEVSSQGYVFAIVSFGLSKVGRDLAWQVIKDNWSELFGYYQGGSWLTPLVKFTTENFASNKKAEEIENFFQQNGCMDIEKTIKQTCESIRLNAAWLIRDYEKLRKFLTEVKNCCKG